MTDRPILFSGPMVRALLDGRKTQTRRIVKPQPPEHLHLQPMFGWNAHDQQPVGTPGLWRVAGPDYPDCAADDRRCPYGVAGDRLWVRENVQRFDKGTCDQHIWYLAGRNQIDSGHTTAPPDLDPDARWPADRPGPGGGSVYSVPCIHMPRWASRLTLTITDVRVERLQDISQADAEAEGVQDPSLVPILGAFWSSRDGYARLWNHINGKGSWAANPWVWAVTFAVERPS